MAAAAKRWLLRMAGRLWWAPAVVVGLAADRGSRGRWLFAPAVVLLTACASTAAKLAIRRPRPGSDARVAPLGHLGAAGFPSTHTACAFAIASWLRGSRQSRWLHLVAIGIGYLRVHRRAHCYGDVAAGAVLGYGIAWKIDNGLSTLLASRTVHTGGPSGETTLVVGGPAPRSVQPSVPRCGSPPRYRRSRASAGRRARSRRVVSSRGAGFQHAHVSAIVSTLGVR